MNLFEEKPPKTDRLDNRIDNLTDLVNERLEDVEEKHQSFFGQLYMLIEKYQESSLPIYSGQTAFFLILSAFPFLLFFFALLDLTPLTEEDFIIWASQIVPASLSTSLADVANEIYQGSSGGIISATIVSSLWLSSKAFVSLQRGLNVMYQVKETRNFILMRLHGIFYSIVLAVLLVVLLAILVFGNSIRINLFPRALFFEKVIHLRVLICIPALFVFFLVLYVVLPNRKQQVRKQIPGAAFAAAAWIIFSYFFSIYVDKFTNYASFYGTMTTIALIMVWLYGCMYVLFLGGWINSALEIRKENET
jgi:membrane protein